MGRDPVLTALLVNPSDGNFEFARQLFWSQEPVLFASVTRRRNLLAYGLADCIEEHFAKNGRLTAHASLLFRLICGSSAVAATCKRPLPRSFFRGSKFNSEGRGGILLPTCYRTERKPALTG